MLAHSFVACLAATHPHTMAPGLSSMMLSFPVLMLAQKIDWEQPENVMYARAAFILVQVVAFLVGKYLAKVRADQNVCENAGLLESLM